MKRQSNLKLHNNWAKKLTVPVAIGLTSLVLSGCGDGGSSNSSVHQTRPHAGLVSVGWRDGRRCFKSVTSSYNENFTYAQLEDYIDDINDCSSYCNYMIGDDKYYFCMAAKHINVGKAEFNKYQILRESDNLWEFGGREFGNSGDSLHIL